MKNWAIYIVVGLGYVIYSVATDADRDSTGAIVDGGNVDAFEIRVGDCFDDTSSSYDGEEIHSLPAVPCSDPHDNEVFAVFDLSITTFPGNDKIAVVAFDSCKNRFRSFVGSDYDSSALDILTLYPSRESWSQNSDREIVCAVYDLEANKIEGSAKGRSL